MKALRYLTFLLLLTGLAALAPAATDKPDDSPEKALGVVTTKWGKLPGVYARKSLHQVAPSIPTELRDQLAFEAKIIATALVGEKGQVEDTNIDQGSGNHRLDEAVKTALAKWRFVPAPDGTRFVAVQVFNITLVN